MRSKEEFEDISPYDDSEFKEKMASLVKEPGFEHAVRYVMPDVDFPAFVEQLCAIDTKSDFQHRIMFPFLEMLAEKTSSGITCSGIENVKDKGAFTYISNHRDIVLDASFLNLCLLRNEMNTTEIAIGSNLLIFDWIRDLVLLNNSFIVKRNLRPMQALEAARQLSGYIHYAINEKHQSIWIAQREGRAKDSNDVTQESLIKMIALGGHGDTIHCLDEINLVPVSISYEYDPNDYLKAREFLLRRNDPEFKKSQRDDLFSMETGLLQNKGRIHFNIGKCINPKLDNLPADADKNEVLHKACKAIDNSIHRGYMIYPINYIAYDLLINSKDFAEHYTGAEVDEFKSYIEEQLKKVDVPELSKDDMEYMRHMMLTMYANPLKNKMQAEVAEI